MPHCSTIRSVLRGLTLLSLLALAQCGGKGGKGGKGGRSAGGGGDGGGDEEIIIPLGTETVIPMGFGGGGGGGGGGGFSIPLDPAMFAGPGGGGQGGPIGFEETETIGPDGKAHIISEKQFGGPPKKLTKAQKQQQKAMQKEMQGMAQDMGTIFSDGGFGFGDGGQRMSRKQMGDANEVFVGDSPAVKKERKAEQDLFRNALQAFNQKGAQSQQLPIIDPDTGYPSGVAPRKSGTKVPNGWEVTGNSDILNQAGIIIASCVILGAILLVGFRFYKTREYATVNDVGDIEAAPFRSL